MKKITFIPKKDYVWKCPDCEKEILASEKDSQEIISSPKCPNCGKKMVGDSLKKH